MREHKTMRRVYSFYDRTGLEKYLEKQALKGWMLEKSTSMRLRFRREEPKAVHYSVAYFPAASDDADAPSEAELTFADFCSHTGWALVVSAGQKKIFRNDQPNPVPIDTDPLVQIDVLHKAAKKPFINPHLINLSLSLTQIWLYVSRFSYGWIGQMSSDNTLALLVYWLFMFIVASSGLVRYYSWRYKAIKAAQTDGTFLDTPNTVVSEFLIQVCNIGLTIMVSVSLWGYGVGLAIIGIAVGIAVLVAVGRWLRKYLKRKNVSAEINLLVTFLVLLALFVMMLFPIVFGIVNAFENRTERENVVGTYEYKGRTYDVVHDEIPLKIEDFMETDYTEYNYHLRKDDSSVFLSLKEAVQKPRYDALDQSEIRYTIVDVKWDWIYDACLRDLLDDCEGGSSEDIYGNVYHDSFVLTDAAPWGADQAYQLKHGGVDELGRTYILCYGDRLVKIQFDWDVTAEQMAAIGDLLKR